jgi:uncharacterized membrane protein
MYNNSIINKSTAKKRIQIIDFFRGLAVILMIIANFSAYFNNSPNNIFFRVIYSFAAPIFLFISGYIYFITSLSALKSFYKFKYGMYIILVAVFIDLFIWQIFPFCTFDVLYIIGFGFIFNMFFCNLNYIKRIILALLILLIPIFFKNLIMYRFQLNELELSYLKDFSWTNYLNLNPLKRFLFDGWFPVFPWLGIILFGYIFAENKIKIIQYTKLLHILGTFGIITGILLVSCNTTYNDRNGYLEVFYPSNFYFLILSVSACTLVGLTLSSMESKSFENHNFITKLGRNSLYIYILHCLVIALIIPKIEEINYIFFWLFSSITLFVFYFILFFTDYLKSKIYYLKRNKIN